MTKEVYFYKLAPKPAVSGERTYEAAAAGRISRGRKWYRLETRPSWAWVFPEQADAGSIIDWYSKELYPDAKFDAVAVDDKLYNLTQPGATESDMVDNAIRCANNHRPGWVVFIPHDLEEEDASVR